MANIIKITVVALAFATYVIINAPDNPTIREATVTYKVYGNTFPELRTSMKNNGPHGFWGYTTWNVNWTSNCRVRVRTEITVPELADRRALTPKQLHKWDQMVIALTAHEQTHASHGIDAANDIYRGNCKNAQSIIKYWNQQDLDFDSDTKHGQSQGVDLHI